MTARAAPVRWRHRAALVLGPVLVLALAGATYQGVVNAIERRAFPHPGRLVDVGGHQLHLRCTGDGRPAVVLESLAGVPAVAWTAVQSRLDPWTAVCSYDRAGLGWSESDGQGFDPANVAPQLHELLVRAAVPLPVVLVGHGLGASLARIHAARFPGDVAAAVLVDLPEVGRARDAGRRSWWMRRPALWPWLARFGVLRLTNVLQPAPGTLDVEAQRAMRAFLNRPDHLSRAVAEIAGTDEAARIGREEAATVAASVQELEIGVSSDRGNVRWPAPLTDPAGIERAAAAVQEAIRRDRRSTRPLR